MKPPILERARSIATTSTPLLPCCPSLVGLVRKIAGEIVDHVEKRQAIAVKAAEITLKMAEEKTKKRRMSEILTKLGNRLSHKLGLDEYETLGINAKSLTQLENLITNRAPIELCPESLELNSMKDLVQNQLDRNDGLTGKIANGEHKKWLNDRLKTINDNKNTLKFKNNEDNKESVNDYYTHHLVAMTESNVDMPKNKRSIYFLGEYQLVEIFHGDNPNVTVFKEYVTIKWTKKQYPKQ